MATVHDVLMSKGESLFTIDANATVLEATRLMNQHKIGAVVVTEEGRVAGIFTERDVLRRVVAEQVPTCAWAT
jgi:CBS domain-containing protein